MMIVFAIRCSIKLLRLLGFFLLALYRRIRGVGPFYSFFFLMGIFGKKPVKTEENCPLFAFLEVHTESSIVCWGFLLALKGCHIY